jgi:DNA polymerase elongation subunit (family B)
MPYTREIGELQTRKGAKGVNYKFLHIDEAKLDIFSRYEGDIPPWEPTGKLTPFNEVSAVYCDLETTGLTPANNEIILIGNRNQKGKNISYGRDQWNERSLLIAFYDMLRKKKPEFLAFFNGFSFDIPFLIKRSELLRVPHPFVLKKNADGSPKIVTVSTAQKNGSPQKYQRIECWIDGHQIQLLDLYHLVLSWDFVFHKLTSHSLKQSVLQIGLRKEQRLELTYPQMMDCWHGFKAGKNDLSRLRSYLDFDLEDTHLLGQYLIPDIYNQLLFLPSWSLQTLATAGNATKWNSFLIDGYNGKQDWNTRKVTFRHEGHAPITADLTSYMDAMKSSFITIEPDTKVSFEGAFTFGKAGIFLNTAKIDVSSLYPGVILGYGIYSCKDLGKKLLSRLAYFRQVRLGYKSLKGWLKGEDVNLMHRIEAIKQCVKFSVAIGFDDALLTDLLKSIVLNDNDSIKAILESLPKAFFKSEGSLKVFINSGYGLFGSTGIAFNDMDCAANVTAYGRKITRFMQSYIETHGGYNFEIDTDGIYFNSESPEKNVEIFEGLQKALPEWIEIELEVNGKLMFNPPVDAKTIKAAAKKGETLDDDAGLVKNYIIINPDGTIFKQTGVRYKARNRCILERDFQPRFLAILQKDGLDSAKSYYENLMKQIRSGMLDLDQITVTRKAGKAEKDVFQRELVDSDGTAKYYVVQETVHMTRKSKIVDVKGCTGDYSIPYYADLIEKQYQEMIQFL